MRQSKVPSKDKVMLDGDAEKGEKNTKSDDPSATNYRIVFTYENSEAIKLIVGNRTSRLVCACILFVGNNITNVILSSLL